MTKALRVRDKKAFSVPVLSRHPETVVTLADALGHMQAHDPDFFVETEIDPVALEIGLRIKQARSKAGLTQKQLAELSGIQQGAISDIERGKGKDGPSYRTVKTLADAMGAELALSPRGLEIDDAVQEANLRKVGNGGRLILTDVLVGSGRLLVPTLKSILSELAVTKLVEVYTTALAKQNDLAVVGSTRSEIWNLEPHGEAKVKVSELSIVSIIEGSGVVSGRVQVTDRVVLATTNDSIQLANTGNTPASVLAIPMHSRLMRETIGA